MKTSDDVVDLFAFCEEGEVVVLTPVQNLQITSNDDLQKSTVAIKMSKRAAKKALQLSIKTQPPPTKEPVWVAKFHRSHINASSISLNRRIAELRGMGYGEQARGLGERW